MNRLWPAIVTRKLVSDKVANYEPHVMLLAEAVPGYFDCLCDCEC